MPQAMNELYKYYSMPKIKPEDGDCILVSLPNAQDFIGQRINPKESLLASVLDHEIQTCLWSCSCAHEPETRANAALNFRCFVVNTAKNSIDNLINKFANQLGPSRRHYLRQDLYPCVINDDGKPMNVFPRQQSQSLQFDICDRSLNISTQSLQQTNHYKTFSLRVISTFEPDRLKGENLKNWTYRLVRQEREVKNILSEYGIQICSPWAFLSRITPDQLHQIESEFSSLSGEKIKEHVDILTELRSVHKERRLRHPTNENNGKKKRGAIPSRLEQLHRRLMSKGIDFKNPGELEAKLKELMKVILKYKSQIAQPKSINSPIYSNDNAVALEHILPDQQPIGIEAIEHQLIEKFYERVQNKFQPQYFQKKVDILDESIKKAVKQRFVFLSKQSQDRAQKYVKALEYFFCAGYSMQDIANNVGLDYQYQVSRLMKLSSNESSQSTKSPDLISSCMLQMAQKLRDQFLLWSEEAVSDDEKQLLDEEPSRIWDFLNVPIKDMTDIFQQARAEISHPKLARNSLFAERIKVLLQELTHCDTGKVFRDD